MHLERAPRPLHALVDAAAARLAERPLVILPGRESRLHIAVPPQAATLAGFREWGYSGDVPESGPVSLINGKLLVDMNPERSRSHNDIKAEIAMVLRRLVRDVDLGVLFVNGAWITNDAAGLSTEPDCAFDSWDCFESGRERVIPSAGDENDGIELRGAVDRVLEVVSPASRKKNTRLLPVAYHQAGVRGLWLVDALGDGIQFAVIVRGKPPSRPRIPARTAGSPLGSSAANSASTAGAIGAAGGGIRSWCVSRLDGPRPSPVAGGGPGWR